MEKKDKKYREIQIRLLHGPAAQRNAELQKEIHSAIGNYRLIRSDVPYLRSKLGKYLKIFSYAVLFAGVSLFFSSCVGYAETEPSFVESARPARPGDAYIWIDGGWRWDVHRRVYDHRQGSWELPRQGRTYESGHWQTTPRGKRWIDGHWNRQNDNENHHRH